MSILTGLQVAVIGGGVGGLAAARILRQAHNVTIYERNPVDSEEPGAAVGLGPNGSKMAKELGLSQEALKAVVSSGFRTFDQNGTLLKETRMDCVKSFGSEWWMVHRQDLKEALLAAATSSDASLAGTPARIVYGAKVTDVDADAGSVHFDDGSKIQADIIIGADGIHSKVCQAVAGLGYPESVAANLSLYRFTFPRSALSELLGSIPEPLQYRDGVFLSSFIATDASNRNVVVYPCRNKELMNFACAVPDNLLKQDTEESWTKEGSVAEMLEHFEDFPHWLITVMKQLSSVKLYQLRDANALPTYTKGCVALIGDAAHPMVPYQGQGANQALEDAEGFKLLLQPGIKDTEVPRILRVWDELRRPRASRVQLHSRIAAAKVSPEVLVQRMGFNWSYDGINSVNKHSQE